MCVGDLSGSPLVCNDGELTGMLVDRTQCAPGAVYTFVDIAHALQWLRINETTGTPTGVYDHFDHFVLINSDRTLTWDYNDIDSFTDDSTAKESTNTLTKITLNSTGPINIHELQQSVTRMQNVWGLILIKYT